MTKEEMIQRGLEAKTLLDSGVFKQCLVHMEDRLAESWKASNPNDRDGRERLYLMVQIMSDLGRILGEWAGQAAFEVHEIERRRQEHHIN